MDVTYSGDDTFVLTGERVVAVNPTTKDADIALYSVRRNRRDQIVDGPGEYEIGGILIVTAEIGRPDRPTLAHSVEIGGLNVVICRPDRRMDGRDIDALGNVDILILDCADLSAARTCITDLDPRVVLPFGPNAAELVTTLGVKDAQPQPRFTWNGTGAVPKAVVLKASGPRRRAA